MDSFYAHPTAVIDAGTEIGAGTKVWHFSHVFAGAVIGERCSFGQNTMVAGGVLIGSNVKVQNNVSIYAGTTIEDDVFLGPSCVLTNVSNPRSQIVRQGIYESTLLRRGTTVGANATIVCGTQLGRYSFISAAAVVTKSVPDYAMIVGVPGKQVGWMSRHGHKLIFSNEGLAICPESGLRYRLERNSVRCIDLDEDRELPESLRNGQKSYREYHVTHGNDATGKSDGINR